ncbi:MAG TPA: 50S ribosomal protein L10 [bacterium]|jgi:large subunit ribosomal protein L10|nr:50S ribosomal protein L10 [bacterium]HOG38175.1 50S ribosomal protein L10 [bacterium]HQI03395.1 50S ribosomal protein L10 [bacterium]
MAKTKLQKQEALKEVKNKLSDSKLVIMTSYEKLSVSKLEELRNELRKNNVFYQVVKKTILKLAKENDIDEGVLESFNGNLSLAYSDDEVIAAKILAKFAKDNKGLQIHGAWLEGNFLTREQVMELSKLLSKEELLAKLLGTIKNPITGFVNVLSANMRGLLNVLNAIKETK